MISALFSRRQDKPIVIEVENWAEMSGNTHARIGLAEGLKRNFERVGKACVIQMRESSPDASEADLLSPDIEIAGYRHRTRASYRIAGNAPNAFGTPFASYSGLAMHHLTDDVLAEAGQAFDERFTKNADRVVMINFATLGHVDAERLDKREFLETLVRRMGPEPFTIFLCGSRHSNVESMRNFSKELRAQAGEMNIAIPIFFFSPRQGMTPEANPYKGLLARASAVIIFGKSLSTMSEAVFAGKQPFVISFMDYHKERGQKSLDDFSNGLSLTCRSRSVAGMVTAWHGARYALHRLNPFH